MKASASSINPTQTDERGIFAVFSDLFKARLTTLVLLTTLVGFYLGTRGSMDYWLMLHALLGTGMLAAGAAALNQLIEREHDAKMERTETRPLPSGRLTPATVLIVGGAISAGGMIYLAFAVNYLTSLLGAVTLLSYLFVYTPLKRITPFNTIIGAVPGALPPLMGWTAVRGEISAGGWALFAILFFWQLPHFLAIAWIYRDEYAKAGYAMLPMVDATGQKTGRQAVSHTLGLLTMSLFPVVLGLVGSMYCIASLVLGFAFLGLAIHFASKLTERSARLLFFASIIYLPLMLGLMVFDKIKH